MIGNIKDFIDLVHDLLLRLGMADWLADIVSAVLAIGALVLLLVYAGHWLISKLLFWNNRRRLSRDLHPFYTKAEIDKATRYYIPTKYQDTAPSQADEPSRSFIDSPKAKLIPMMLKTAFQQDDSRYYLILADSGMGKTTFMMNLFLAYKNQWPWKQKHDIRLLPLGHPQTLAEVEKIQNPEHTILLLDALDEDVEAVKDYKNRLGEILDKTWKFREVVITCRTQFFPSEVEEPSKTGYFRYGTDGGEHFFRKAYVSVFDDKDINRYLRKRFKFWQWKDRRKARRIVQKSPNLMVRPMLLSHIQDLVGEEREYEYTYQIYEVLIQKWVERECNKPIIELKYHSKALYREKLESFSHDFALNLFVNREKRGGLFSIHFSEKIPTDSGLQLSNYEAIAKLLKDKDLKERSLLNRDSDGNYKFAHKSIFEYFLANCIINNKLSYDEINLKGLNSTRMFLGDYLIKVIYELATSKDAILFKDNKTIDILFFTSKSIQNIDKIRIKNTSKININLILNNLPNYIHTIEIADMEIVSTKRKFNLLFFYYNLMVLKTLNFDDYVNKIAEFNIIRALEEIPIKIGNYTYGKRFDFELRLSRYEQELITEIQKIELSGNTESDEKKQHFSTDKDERIRKINTIKTILKELDGVKKTDSLIILPRLLEKYAIELNEIIKCHDIMKLSLGFRKSPLFDLHTTHNLKRSNNRSQKIIFRDN